MHQLETVNQATIKTVQSGMKNSTKLVLLASLLLVAGVVFLQNFQTSNGRQFLQARVLKQEVQAQDQTSNAALVQTLEDLLEMLELPQNHTHKKNQELNQTLIQTLNQTLEDLEAMWDLPNTTFHNISFSDYHAKPNPNLTFWAYTIWNVPYTYEEYDDGEKATIIVDVKCELNKATSWVLPEYESDELLKHETGHFRIGSLFALNFKKAAQETKFSIDNYNQEVSDLYNNMLKDYLAMEIRYDLETTHFWNRTAQHQWDVDLITKINELKEYWW